MYAATNKWVEENVEENVLMLANKSSNLTCKSSHDLGKVYPVSWSNCKDDTHCIENSNDRISYCRQNQSTVAHVRFKVVLLSDSGTTFTCWSFKSYERVRVSERQRQQVFVTESLHSEKATGYGADELNTLRRLRGRWLAIDCRARKPSGIDIILDWRDGSNQTNSLTVDETRIQPFQRRRLPSRYNQALSTLYIPQNYGESDYACVAVTSLSSKLDVLIRKVKVRKN